MDLGKCSRIPGQLYKAPVRLGEEFRMHQAECVVGFFSSHIQLPSCRVRVGEVESSRDGVYKYT